ERQRLADELRALDMRRIAPALESVVRRRAVCDELGRIRTPTLVLHGAEDRAVVPERGRRTAGKIAGARLVVVPRAGRPGSVGEPDAVSRELTACVGAV